MSTTTTEAAMRAALVDPTLPVPAGLISPRGLADRRRFAVYRNNVHVSLVNALASRFPVTRRIVGAEFFTAMARVYVGETKPSSPVLLHYGDDLAEFISGFPPAASLPYLPDVARLEVLWSRAYHAADLPVLELSELGQVPIERLLAQPLPPAGAAGLLRSPFAVGSIWSAHMIEPFRPPRIDTAEAVLVTRPDADVRVTVIPSVDAVFLAALADGAKLEAALQAAFASDTTFNAGAALAGLTGLGAFATLGEPQ